MRHYRNKTNRLGDVRLLKSCVRVLGLITGLLLGGIIAPAQVNTRVHSGATMYVFSEDTMSIWGNATNYGSFGTKEQGVVHFYGTTWANYSSATMPGAGTFYFQQPRPAPYANNVQQNLEGGYNMGSATGCSFPDLHLDNANDLLLVNNDAKTRDTFNFVDGHVIHEGMDFTVGDNDPGEILNYNETQFFVTNGTGTTKIGFLERESLSNTDLEEAFPIGNAIGDYTPGRIKNIGTDDDFQMRVFNDVFDKGYSGVTKNDASVGKTWDVEERTTGGSNVTLELQHNSTTEGTTFAGQKSNHYITHYVGSNPNGVAQGNGVDTTSNSFWDLLKVSNLYGGESGSGYITTGTTISGALVTKRSNLDAFSPYTKTVYDLAPLPVELIELDGQWDGNDAHITWATASELDNSHFDVERSFDGVNYEYLNSVGSKAEGGNSSGILRYDYVDREARLLTESEVFYRLVQHDYDGDYEVLGPVILYTYTNRFASGELNLYPNPSSSRTHIVKANAGRRTYQLQITNMAGQVVFASEVDGVHLEEGYSFDVSNMPTGMYVVRLSNEVSLDSRKFSVSHK